MIPLSFYLGRSSLSRSSNHLRLRRKKRPGRSGFSRQVSVPLPPHPPGLRALPVLRYGNRPPRASQSSRNLEVILP